MFLFHPLLITRALRWRVTIPKRCDDVMLKLVKFERFDNWSGLRGIVRILRIMRSSGVVELRYVRTCAWFVGGVLGIVSTTFGIVYTNHLRRSAPDAGCVGGGNLAFCQQFKLRVRLGKRMVFAIRVVGFYRGEQRVNPEGCFRTSVGKPPVKLLSSFGQSDLETFRNGFATHGNVFQNHMHCTRMSIECIRQKIREAIQISIPREMVELLCLPRLELTIT